MPSVLFESSDTDAPVLNQNPGSLIDVLRACLITGYGSKAALGWEEVFYDSAGHRIVIRQKESKAHRPFIYISDTGVYRGSTQSDRVYIYDIMYDIDNGVNRQPITSDNYDYHNFAKSMSNTVNADWKLIGDSRGFWFLVRYWPANTDSAEYVWIPHYIGDFNSWMLDYKFPFVTDLLKYAGMYPFMTMYGGCKYIYRTLDNHQPEGDIRLYLSGLGGSTVSLNPGNLGYRTGNTGVPYFAGTVSYHPLFLETWGALDGTGIIGCLPGYSPALRAMDSLNRLPLEAPYLEVINSDTSLYIFTIKTDNDLPANGASGRLAIVVGEGFRNVF